MQDFKFQKTFETVRGGFATPHRLSGVPGNLTGCIYRADGTKVVISERMGGKFGDIVPSDNPSAIEFPHSARELQGRGVYLGNYMGPHYGHFITENLSTFWIFQDFPATYFDYFLMHPFVFGDSMPEYVRYCLKRFEIPEDKVIIVGEQPLALEEIVVPERLFHLNYSADPRLKWVYDHIAAGVDKPTSTRARIYVSRRRFKMPHRAVANEVQIEDAFARRGFEIVYPETLSFEEQVSIYAHADVLAGMAGSGLHNSLFMRPHSQVGELGDLREERYGKPCPTQILCDHVAGVKNIFIPFSGWRVGVRSEGLFDMRMLEPALDAAFGSSSKREPGLREWPHWLSMRAEIAYRVLRSLAGGLVRQRVGRRTG